MPTCELTIYYGGRLVASYTVALPGEREALMMAAKLAEMLPCRLGAPERRGGETRIPCGDFTLTVRCEA